METTTTLGDRIIEHLPFLGTNAALATVVAISVGEPSDHTAVLVVGEVVIGFVVNGVLYLLNDKYRVLVAKMGWKLGRYPKGTKRFERILPFIAFLMRHPQLVEELKWAMPEDRKAKPPFEDPKGFMSVLLMHIYDLIVAAKVEGAHIHLRG